MTGAGAAAGRAEAERRKLAHSLGVEPERLSMLAGLPAEEVRALRRQIADALFRADRQHFVRVAALAKAVPVAVAARLTEAVLPALLAARTAELLEPARAAELVARISDGYLADVSAAMDASRAPAVIAAIPPERVAAVAAELGRRGEWVVIGGFVSQVSDQALARSVAVFDGGQLLRIGYVLDDADRLDRVTGLLSDRQLDELLAAAAADGLWTEFTDLLDRLGPAQRSRLADRFARLTEQDRARFPVLP